MGKQSRKKASERTRGWIAGLIRMPGRVTDGDSTFQASVLAFLDATGPVIGSAVDRPEALLEAAPQHLAQAMRAPLVGRPRTPSSLRVDSEALAAALRGRIDPSIEVRVGDCPELRALAEYLEEQADDEAFRDEGHSYLNAGVDAARMAELFQLAAALFRAAPWKHIPGDVPIRIDAEQLGLDGAVLSVIGQMGQSLGFLVFANRADYEALLALDGAPPSASRSLVPPHLALSFDDKDDVPPALLEEITRHRWPVAGRDAYPSFMRFHAGEVALPSPSELTTLEAIARALVAPGVLESASGGLRPGTQAPWRHAAQVNAAGHGVEFHLSAQAPEPEERLSVTELLLLLARLEERAHYEGPRLTAEVLYDVHEQMLDAFSASPEGRAFDEALWAADFLDCAADLLGRTLYTLDRAALQEILHQMIEVDAVAFGPPDPEEIAAELRAFFAFIGRETEFPRAPEWHRAMDDGAVEILRAAILRALTPRRKRPAAKRPAAKRPAAKRPRKR